MVIRAIAGLVAVLVGTGSALAQEYTFKLHHFLPPKTLAHELMLEPWAHAVEENSGGNVKIEIFPAMSLGGKPPELIQQVRDGVVDLVWTVNGYTPGLFPRTEVFDLPGVHINNAVATNLALHEMRQKELADDYRGLEVMFLHVHGGQGIHMADTEVRSPADLEGKKMRIPTRTGAWMIEALGAAPAAMPVPDLPQALSKQVVDGALIPWEIMPALKLQDQTDYQIEGVDGERFGNATFQVSMNQGRWDSLPEDIQQAFIDASGPEWLRTIGTIWTERDGWAIEIAVESGNTHIMLSEEETQAFRGALAPVVDRWVEEVTAKGIDGASLVERARALIDRNSQ